MRELYICCTALFFMPDHIIVSTSWGRFKLRRTAAGLSGCTMIDAEQHKQATPPELYTEGSAATEDILADSARQLQEYLAGERSAFEIDLDLSSGTDFQQRVWRQLLKIPYGETCSYGDIAIALDLKGAERAIGTANGKNPIAIIVPCHRVITSSGALGGYFYGTEMKRRLLSMEARRTPVGLFDQF